uniref:low-density lipoprotein receptor-related protein 12-like n=1 Tax=Pristiophorus japonicus TaxID=55135 RepID=UPI00398E46D5
MAVSRFSSTADLSPWTGIPALVLLLLPFTGNIVLGEKYGSGNAQISEISTACGGAPEQLRAPSGIITSPGWPFNYQTRVNCSWYIQANPEDVITISFQDFDIQSSAWCSSDWLTIGTYKSVEGTRVCGSSIPAPYISSKDHVWIKFHSDDRYTGKGFRLSYVTGNPSESRMTCFHTKMNFQAIKSYTGILKAVLGFIIDVCPG